MAEVIELPDRSNPKLDALVEGWIGHYWSADHQIVWKHAEQEVAIWLDPHTLLAGRIDARGVMYDSRKFFADWKTAAVNKKKTWKAKWRKSVQALTYGMMLREIDPTQELFLVRMAFKDNTYDQEWFEYEGPELDFWRGVVIDVAKEIRAWRIAHPDGPWSPNFDNCFRYGIAYQCPYFDNGCDKLAFNSKLGLIDRIPHLKIEQDMRVRSNMMSKDFVLLDATRVESWMGCHEKYRKEWEMNLRAEEPSEALEFGLDFHKLLDVYYRKLIAGKL